MKLYVLTEPLFRSSPWCVRIVSGLHEALRSKKLEASYLEAAGELPPAAEAEPGFVLVIGCNPDWVDSGIAEAKRHRLHPVVISCSEPGLPFGVSAVCTSADEATAALLNVLKSGGHKRPALYGCNPDSLSDRRKEQSFLSNPIFPVTKDDVFVNRGSLAGCYSDFRARISEYDSVICVNSYSALHLTKKLKAEGIDRMTASFGDARLLHRCAPGILTVSARYEEFGKAAVSVCEQLSKNPALEAMLLYVRWDTSRLGGNGADPVHAAAAEPSTADTRFYGDADMRNMLSLENMLLSCSDTQLNILDLLLDGGSAEDIAEQCYLSLSSVKYNIRRLEQLADCGTKAELLAKMRAYTDGSR